MVSESEGGDRSENERQLVALLKSAQEEREELLLKQVCRLDIVFRRVVNFHAHSSTKDIGNTSIGAIWW